MVAHRLVRLDDERRADSCGSAFSSRCCTKPGQMVVTRDAGAVQIDAQALEKRDEPGLRRPSRRRTCGRPRQAAMLEMPTSCPRLRATIPGSAPAIVAAAPRKLISRIGLTRVHSSFLAGRGAADAGVGDHQIERIVALRRAHGLVRGDRRRRRRASAPRCCRPRHARATSSSSCVFAARRRVHACAPSCAERERQPAADPRRRAGHERGRSRPRSPDAPTHAPELSDAVADGGAAPGPSAASRSRRAQRRPLREARLGRRRRRTAPGR